MSDNLTPAPRLTPDLCAVIDYARRELRDDLADDAAVELSDLLAAAERLTHALTACQQCQAGHELGCATLTMRADSADWAAEDVQAENRLLTVAVAELTARALKAEAGNTELRNEAVALHREVGRLSEYRQTQEWLTQMRAGYPSTSATAAADKLEARIREQQDELGSQEVQMLELVKEKARLVDTLLTAKLALEWSYDVTDYPADGTSQQAKALDKIKQALATPAP